MEAIPGEWSSKPKPPATGFCSLQMHVSMQALRSSEYQPCLADFLFYRPRYRTQSDGYRRNSWPVGCFCGLAEPSRFHKLMRASLTSRVVHPNRLTNIELEHWHRFCAEQPALGSPFYSA